MVFPHKFTEADTRKGQQVRAAEYNRRIKRAHQMHDKGLTRKEIAIALGVKLRRVNQYLKVDVPK